MGTVRLGLAPIVVFLPQTFYYKTIGPTVTYVKYGRVQYLVSQFHSRSRNKIIISNLFIV